MHAVSLSTRAALAGINTAAGAAMLVTYATVWDVLVFASRYSEQPDPLKRMTDVGSTRTAEVCTVGTLLWIAPCSYLPYLVARGTVPIMGGVSLYTAASISALVVGTCNAALGLQ